MGEFRGWKPPAAASVEEWVALGGRVKKVPAGARGAPFIPCEDCRVPLNPWALPVRSARADAKPILCLACFDARLDGKPAQS